jgi:hypothetical protein
MSKVYAPFTPDQVASLNAYQRSGTFHEFTCGSDNCHAVVVYDSKAILHASPKGWKCPFTNCDYTQDWAYDWMADWTWKTMRQMEGAS